MDHATTTTSEMGGCVLRALCADFCLHYYRYRYRFRRFFGPIVPTHFSFGYPALLIMSIFSLSGDGIAHLDHSFPHSLALLSILTPLFPLLLLLISEIKIPFIFWPFERQFEPSSFITTSDIFTDTNFGATSAISLHGDKASTHTWIIPSAFSGENQLRCQPGQYQSFWGVFCTRYLFLECN